MSLSRALGWVLLAATGIAACGGGDALTRTGHRKTSTPPANYRPGATHSAIPVESCARPAARKTIHSDVYPQDGVTAVSIGPLSLVIGPFSAAPGRVAAPKATVALAGPRAATLIVDRSSRQRLSLLFAGASTGRADTGFGIADGVAAVRFPVCSGHATTFLGGALLRGRGCVHLHVIVAGKSERVFHGTVGCR
jgi:hypothetical protein